MDASFSPSVLSPKNLCTPWTRCTNSNTNVHMPIAPSSSVRSGTSKLLQLFICFCTFSNRCKLLEWFSHSSCVSKMAAREERRDDGTTSAVRRSAKHTHVYVSAHPVAQAHCSAETTPGSQSRHRGRHFVVTKWSWGHKQVRPRVEFVMMMTMRLRPDQNTVITQTSKQQAFHTSAMERMTFHKTTGCYYLFKKQVTFTILSLICSSKNMYIQRDKVK